MNQNVRQIMELLDRVDANGCQHTLFNIIESDPIATLRRVTINASSGDWFVFSPDKGQKGKGKMSPLLSTDRKFDHNRACDSLLLIVYQNTYYAIFMELKSGKTKGSPGQLRSTRCFFRYLLEIAKEFHQINIHKIEERFIVFVSPQSGHHTLAKKPSVMEKKYSPSSDPRNPAKYQVNNGDTIFLREILI